LADELEPGGAPVGRSAGLLDDVDRRLLVQLMREGRASVRSLAERLHISRANAYARIQRLRDDGVLVGFRAVVDPERAGLGTSAYVSLAFVQNSWREVAARLKALDYV
jgi:DNA-binding Lrp family transcriptional regulator